MQHQHRVHVNESHHHQQQIFGIGHLFFRLESKVMNHAQRRIPHAVLRHLVQSIGKHIPEFCAVRIYEADLRPPR